MNCANNTSKTYGFLWKSSSKLLPPKHYHFDKMQEVIDEPLVRGAIGIDIGSGCGYDTCTMAKNNPAVTIISMDLSDGVYVTKDLSAELKNVRIIKGSVSETPFKDNLFDFAYSFGVLHHIENPKKGLLEIARIVKTNCPVFLYLYEDHSENPIKYIGIKLTSKIRNITVKMPQKACYILSCILSPFIVIAFSFPARIFRRFNATQNMAARIPFNFGIGPFSLRGDLYDRFNAPVEYRFSREGLYNMLGECGFYNVNITRLKGVSGWVAWGYKR